MVLSTPTLALPEHRTPRVSHPCPLLAAVRQWSSEARSTSEQRGQRAGRAEREERRHRQCCALGAGSCPGRCPRRSGGPGVGWRAPPGRLRLRAHPPPGSCQCPRRCEPQPCSDPAAHPAGRSLRARSSPAAEGRGSVCTGPRPRSTDYGLPSSRSDMFQERGAGWQRNRKETQVQQTLGHLFPGVSCVRVAQDAADLGRQEATRAGGASSFFLGFFNSHLN